MSLQIACVLFWLFSLVHSAQAKPMPRRGGSRNLNVGQDGYLDQPCTECYGQRSGYCGGGPQGKPYSGQCRSWLECVPSSNSSDIIGICRLIPESKLGNTSGLCGTSPYTGSTINCRKGSRCLGPSESFYEPSVCYTPKPQDLKNGCGGPKGDTCKSGLVCRSLHLGFAQGGTCVTQKCDKQCKNAGGKAIRGEYMCYPSKCYADCLGVKTYSPPC